MTRDAGPRELVLLYDGLCPYCNGIVRFVLDHDRTGTMKFAALQSDYARAVLARHPDVQGYDTAAVVDSRTGAEHVHVRSEATLAIAAYLGGPWRLLRVLRLIPRPLRDWGYDVFALMRYRLFGQYDACPVPDATVRERFYE